MVWQEMLYMNIRTLLRKRSVDMANYNPFSEGRAQEEFQRPERFNEGSPPPRASRRHNSCDESYGNFDNGCPFTAATRYSPACSPIYSIGTSNRSDGRRFHWENWRRILSVIKICSRGRLG
jgi:hypothetical protein